MKYGSVAKAKMKDSVFLVLFCALISETVAQNSGNCRIPEISDIGWSIRYTNDAIKDTDTLRKEFIAESEIQLDSFDGNGYLNVVVEESSLIITTTDAFENYEANAESGSGEHVLTAIIYLKCETSELSMLNFRQPINDTNNHYPEFDQDSYEYQVPMPMTANLELSYFGPTITVEDLDITNDYIYFSINTEDFIVETEGPVDSLNKHFRPRIIAAKALRYTESQSFILTATDNGVDPGPLSRNATITIEVDTANSYPEAPSFTEIYYKGSYISEDPPSVDIGPIYVSTDYENYESLEFYLEGDYRGFFEVSWTERAVTLSVLSPLTTEILENESVIILTLVAQEPEEYQTGSAVLVIEIPKEKYIDPPSFTKSYYNGTYYINAENNGEINTEEILLDYDDYEQVTFELQGDHASYFDIQRNERKAEVSVNQKLSDDILENTSSITLVVVARVDGTESTGNAALIISLPVRDDPVPPNFTALYYTGSYKISGSTSELDELDLDSIQISEDYNNYESLVLTLAETEYSSFFNAQLSGRTVEITLKENLPSEVLKTEAYVTLAIIATADNNAALVGSTILITSLPEEPESPSFTELYYEGKYAITDDGPQLNVDGISLSADYANYESVGVTLQQEEYRNYFEVNRIGRIIDITLTNPLTETILQNNVFLTLTIVATAEGNSDLAGYTVVIISLPESEETTVVASPSFTEPYYEGKYAITEDEPQLTVDDISLSANYTDYESVGVILQQEEYRNYFEVSRTGHTINIILTNPLTQTILQNNAFLALTIVATVEGNSDLVGYTVVIISLPESEESSTLVPPSFSAPYYEGKYTITENEPELTLDDISLSADYTDYESVDVTLQQEEYRDYFEVSRTGRTINIILTNPLTQTILQNNAFLALTIVATAEGNSDLVGYTVVIISLPESEESSTLVPPSFTEPYYEGKYTITENEPELTLDDISLSGDYTDYESVDVTLQQEEYRNYFEVSRTGRTINIILRNPLTQTILQNNAFLALTIVATAEGNSDLVGYTVVIISLPESEGSSTLVPPSFSEPYYEGKYTITENEPKLTVDDISLSADYTDYESVDVTLQQEEYRDYFEVSRTGRTINIILTNPLTQTILQNNAFLALTIVATAEGNSDLVGYTVVIISLPESEGSSTLVPPSFTEPYYEGKYTITENEPELTLDDISLSADYTDYESVDVTLQQEEYRNYFEVSRTGRTINIILTNPLTQTILQNNAFLALTIVATVEGNSDLVGYTVVIISLPESEGSSTLVPPSFTEPYYEGKYTITENKPELTVDDISLSADYTDYESVDVTLQQEEYRNYFEVSRTGRTINIILTNPLTQTILQNNAFLALTIVATAGGNNDLVGYTVVIISLPESEGSATLVPPSFTEPYYEGKYTITENEPELTVDDISLSADYTDYESVDVALQQEEYRNYFEVSRTGRTINIILTNPLTQTILQNNAFLALTIVATAGGNNDLVGYTVVIISLPESEGSATLVPPSFTEPYYEGKYTITENEPELTVDDISLSADYTDYESVDVALQQEEYRNYFEVSRTGRTINIILTNPLTQTILQNNAFLALTIVATAGGNSDLVGYTVVIISLPESEESTVVVPPSFTEVHYKGTYTILEDVHEVTTDDISLSADYTDYELIDVALQPEAYRSYFQVSRNGRTVTMTLTNPLPDTILQSNAFITLVIVATVQDNDDLTGYTVLIISLPESDDTSTVALPSFTKPYYNASYTITEDKHELVVEEISLSPDFDAYEFATITLQEEEYRQYFNASRTERTVHLTVAENLSNNILDESSILVVTLVASVESSRILEGYTVVVIFLPEPEEEGVVVPPSFTKPYYEANYTVTNNEHELSVEEINISSDYEDYESVIVTLQQEGYYEYFRVSRSERSVELERLRELPDLTDGSIIILTIVATVEDKQGYAVVIISYTSESSVETVIEFEEDIYRFSTDPDRIGVIGAVRAVSTSTTEVISYSITDSDGNAFDNIRISESTGIISNIEYLEEGYTYNNLVVHASGNENQVTASAQVLINVNIRSAYSTLVRHIVEEEENTDILVLDENYKNRGLWYEIHKQYPTNGTDLFTINPDTGSLESLAVDRESSLIADMYLPQLTVVLRLVNHTELSRKKRSYFSDYPLKRTDAYPAENMTWIYLEDDLPNLASQTVVFIVVDDINDNPPTFVSVKRAVGYPTKDLFEEILPSYVTSVEATDPDNGYNASILYTSTNDEFYIHPTTGVVYPTDKLFDSDEKSITLRLVATDQNGIGLSSSTTIEVVLLEKDEISILSVEGEGLENADDKLSELSSLLNLNFGYLAASVVVDTDLSKSVRASTKSYLTIVVYALDSNNEPISGSTLEDTIKDLNLDETWSVQSWESYTKEIYKTSTASSTGLLVAVIILAILLLLFLAGVAGAIYYYKFRRSKYVEMNEDRDSPIDFKKEPRADELVTPPPFTGFIKNPTTTTSIVPLKVVMPPRRPTGHSLYVNGEAIQGDEETKITEGNSTEVSTTSSYGAETERKASPGRERKKSVAFSENVEKMELEGDEVQSTDL